MHVTILKNKNYYYLLPKLQANIHEFVVTRLQNMLEIVAVQKFGPSIQVD